MSVTCVSDFGLAPSSKTPPLELFVQTKIADSDLSVTLWITCGSLLFFRICSSGVNNVRVGVCCFMGFGASQAIGKTENGAFRLR